MTIIVFLIDTSASMNQRTYLGISLLDMAKGAVETFMKFRSRDQSSRWDRYMLLTFEDPPFNIKAGWKESHATFIQELKNLHAYGLTNLGASLKHAFDLLNVNRMQSGIDTYGQGRCPFFLEPAVIICITDGRKLTTSGGVQCELNLPMNLPVPGCELTKEPFRWDQRLYGLALRVPATAPTESQLASPFIPSAEDSPIDAMCEVTGGRSYLVSSQRQLMQCLESLCQKAQPGVVINFEKIGPDPPPVNGDNKLGDISLDANGPAKENMGINRLDIPPVTIPFEKEVRCLTPTPPSSQAWHSCRKLIYVQRSAQKGYAIGHWPIPEAFWPDPNLNKLPPRSAHPVVKFTCTLTDPMVVENFPFDKYELEPSPLTQYILERRQPNVCWQVFLQNSSKVSERDFPFGYIKASSNLLSVNLFVMPYNYPVLLPLLEELIKVYKWKPPSPWRVKFDQYLKEMPTYYAGPLKRALQRMGGPNLVPENLDNNLSYSVISYLKKLKNQAKLEFERVVATVGHKTNQSDGIKVHNRSKTSILQRKDLTQILQGLDTGDISLLRQDINEFPNFTLAVQDRDIKPQYYRNPFDIPRKTLLDQIARMRANLLQSTQQKLVDDDQNHSIPVQQMGNYQEYLKKATQPLREIESQPVRQHMFGNPFKVNKNIMIDEADEAMPGAPPKLKRQNSNEIPPGSPVPKRRKPGPLPRDTPIRRPSTPSLSLNGDLTPPSSPALSTSDILDSLTEESDTDTDTELIANNNIDKYNNHIAEEYMDLHHPPDPLGGADISDRNNGSLSRRLIIVQDHNTKLKFKCCQEIRRPGRKYDVLFEAISAVQGNLDVKCAFLRDVMHEAARFKKKILIGLLEQFETTLVRSEMRMEQTMSAEQVSPNR